MTAPLDLKRILIYLLIAFGFTWAVDAVLYLRYSSVVTTDTAAALPMLALLTLSMFGPMLGHIGTRLLTREGWRDTGLRPRFRHGWRYWLLIWLLVPVCVLLGAALYFMLFPQHFDASLPMVQEQIAKLESQSGQSFPLSPQLLALIQLVQAILLAPLLNAIPIFGEEFGWRGYLLPKLLPLGERCAYLVSGLIWGLWHAPIIAMGHNYGTSYAGAPWAGILMMCWFTLVFGTLLGWATLRAGSIWPAVIGHGLVNGIAAIALFATKGEPNPLLGPLVAGAIGSIGFAVAAALIFLRRTRATPILEQPTLTVGGTP